ncbi:MAG: hypothetical protein IRY99_12525 [Isosphaeraceae bacterium]|nr:hypothetical protein [Isosphaeraceae bacterium]
MKRVLAGIATIALMGLLLWNGLRQPPAPTGGGEPSASASTSASSRPSPAEEAEAEVRALLEKGRSGDVTDYLDAFTGPIRERIDREVRERGRDAFAAELRRAAAARKSHAVFAPEPDGPDAYRVTVESVYPDRNERQTYRIVKVAEGWRIADVETLRTHQPKAKYGAPADFIEPEGVPIPAQPYVSNP